MQPRGLLRAFSKSIQIYPPAKHTHLEGVGCVVVQHVLQIPLAKGHTDQVQNEIRQINQNVGADAADKAVGNRVGQGHQHNSDEGRHSLTHLRHNTRAGHAQEEMTSAV